MSLLLHTKPTTLRNRLFAYFFTNPTAWLHLREIARKLDVSPGNLSKELKRLTDEGIFKAETRGRQKFFSLNAQHPLHNELKSIVFKTIGVEGALKQLVQKQAGIEWAFIYGSFATGKTGPNSDIDLALMVQKNIFDANGFATQVRKLEKRLQREINYVFHTPSEWVRLKRKKDSFILQIDKGSKIELLKKKASRE